MKKSLVTMAVLSAVSGLAFAQTNVQIGGRVQANIKSYKVGNTARPADTEFRIDDDETSRFWLKGSEDLGGGTKALFYVENRFNTDVSNTSGDGNGLANGDTYLGLAGNFGQLTIGKHTMMESQGNAVQYGIKGGQAIPSSLLGSKTILNFVESSGLNTSRVQNSVLYTSPKVGGFKGTVGFSTSANGNDGTLADTAAAGVDYEEGRAFFVAGNYSNGPIYANLAYWDNEIELTGVSHEQLRLSGSYAFPFGLKIGAQWDRATITSVAGVERERDAWQLPVSYQFGNNTILASYTKAKDVDGEPESGAKLWTIGYDYALSKRTNVGLFYGKLDNDVGANYQPYKSGTSQNGSTLLNGESGSILALSVKHTF